MILAVRIQDFLDVDFLICSLGKVSPTPGALGTDWQKEAGGLNSQYVGNAVSLVHHFLLPYSIPLFNVGFGASVRGSVSPQSQPPVQLLLAWGNSGPLASQGWDGNPSTALPPVNVAAVLITYLFQESGAYYLLRLCRSLLGESAFYTTLRFLFPPPCKVLWHSSFYLSPKRFSKVS